MKFIIHEHHAKRAGLHWDLRLQFRSCKHKDDLCLYSFATRKLPDFFSGKLKRILLFQTPDHEKWWLNFEGELTQGYGAGMIYIWDKGTITWIEDSPEKKIFCLDGKKVKGCFAMLKLKYNDSAQNEWLLIKMKKTLKELKSDHKKRS